LERNENEMKVGRDSERGGQEKKECMGGL